MHLIEHNSTCLLAGNVSTILIKQHHAWLICTSQFGCWIIRRRWFRGGSIGSNVGCRAFETRQMLPDGKHNRVHHKPSEKKRRDIDSLQSSSRLWHPLQVSTYSVCSLQVCLHVCLTLILTGIITLHSLSCCFVTFPHSLVVTAVVAMYVEASVIAYVAFAFPLVTAPLTIQQHYKLWKMSST